MGELIVRLLPLAAGIALSPLPVVAVLVILVSKRAFPGSITLAVSWVLGVAVAIGISIAFTDTIKVPKVGVDPTAEGVFALLLGAGLLIMAYLSKRGRRLSPHPDEPPSWVSSVDHLGPWAAAFVAFSNATTSPKNLALAITAGKTVVAARLPSSEASIAVLVYVVVASVTIVAPVLIFIFGGQRSVATLTRWRERVTANAGAVMEIVLVVIGIGMSAKGLYNLFA